MSSNFRLDPSSKPLFALQENAVGSGPTAVFILQPWCGGEANLTRATDTCTPAYGLASVQSQTRTALTMGQWQP